MGSETVSSIDHRRHIPQHSLLVTRQTTMASTASLEGSIEKDWYHAVKSYHEHSFRSPLTFLSSDRATEFGLDLDNIREFRLAVQSFDARWQAAVKVYIQGRYTTPRKFVSSGKFLKLGFSPSREHAKVLGFALKFYEEEGRYRHNANSDEVTAVGRYGGSAKPMYAITKTRTPHRVVGFDQNAIEGADDIPTLVDLSDDLSAESISRLSGDCSITNSMYNISMYDRRKYVQVLLSELSYDRRNKNSLDAMMFFIFAVIPLCIFCQLRAVAEILLPFDFLWSKEEVEEEPEGIEDEWQKLRSMALMLEEDAY